MSVAAAYGGGADILLGLKHHPKHAFKNSNEGATVGVPVVH